MRIEGKVEPAYKLIPHATVEKKGGEAEGGREVERFNEWRCKKCWQKLLLAENYKMAKGHETQERREEQE